MYTDDAEGGVIVDVAGVGVSAVVVEGRPFRPRTGVVLSSLFDLYDNDPGMTEGSSNWPAGVRRSPPSGLNVRRLKKFVKLSSP
jgi:hypothetical protein